MSEGITARTLRSTHRKTARVSGDMSIALERQTSLSTETVDGWARALREAADELDALALRSRRPYAS